MNLAEMCAATNQSGNALLILLLIRSWEGANEPTRDELAALAHVTPRQAERHLIKLIADGEIEKSTARGRGVKTTFHAVNLSYPSDKTQPEVSDQKPLEPQSLSDVPVILNRDKSEGNDISTAENVRLKGDISDVSDTPKSGTPVAPNRLNNTSTDKELKTKSTAPRKRVAEPAMRLPESFALTPAMREWALREAADVDLDRALAEFADYWRGVPGSRGKKLDWEATWRNRMRELQGRAAQRKVRRFDERKPTAQPSRVETILDYDYSGFGNKGEESGERDRQVSPVARLEPAAAERSDGDGRRVAGTVRR